LELFLEEDKYTFFLGLISLLKISFTIIAVKIIVINATNPKTVNLPGLFLIFSQSK